MRQVLLIVHIAAAGSGLGADFVQIAGQRIRNLRTPGPPGTGSPALARARRPPPRLSRPVDDSRLREATGQADDLGVIDTLLIRHHGDGPAAGGVTRVSRRMSSAASG